jgi:hypothetical protein
MARAQELAKSTFRTTARFVYVVAKKILRNVVIYIKSGASACFLHVKNKGFGVL